MDSRSADVVVLGAGPAGLAAALVAARGGRDVSVIEASGRVGGMAASLEVAGQSVDLGSHRLHRATRPDVLALIGDLIGADLQPRPRAGRIRLAGRWLGFPLRPLDVALHAPPRLAAGFARDLVTSPWRTARADTFAELVRAGPGPTLLDAFYGPYARKLWAVDADQLSAELFRRRVSARSGGALLRRIVRPVPRGRPGFWYPKRGFGQISEALAEAAVAAGARIALSAPLASAVRHGDRWTVSAGTESVDTPLVISTIPNTAVVGAARAEPDVVAAADALRHRGAVLVYLAVDRPRYTAFDAHYFPEPGITAARLSEPKNYRDGDDPETCTVLCAEIPASVGDPMWSAADADLAAAVADDLARARLPLVTPFTHVVVRLPSVYPVYDVGFEASQRRVERWADDQPGLVLVGRQALFAHDNTHHAIEMGVTAGALAADPAGWDRDAWASAREHFRAHVVED